VSLAAAHRWAQACNTEILVAPRAFPEYGQHCYARYRRDPHGIKLEAVCHEPERD
jgi:hypothetical protein